MHDLQTPFAAVPLGPAYLHYLSVALSMCLHVLRVGDVECATVAYTTLLALSHAPAHAPPGPDAVAASMTRSSSGSSVDATTDSVHAIEDAVEKLSGELTRFAS